MLAITHYNRLLHELRPDHVHVLGRRRASSAAAAPSWPLELEATGYAAFGEDEDGAAGKDDEAASNADPFADPFADPLA